MKEMVENLFKEYSLYLQALGRSEKTMSWYLQILNRFFAFLESNQEPDDISRIDRKVITRYILHLRESPRWPGKNFIGNDSGNLSPFSIQGHVRALKAFFSWLQNEGYIEKNPLLKYHLPEVPDKIIRVINPQDFDELLNHIDRKNPVGDRYYCLLLLLFDTGMRISEAVNIKTNEFTIDRECLSVRGKGNKERSVPISPETRREINHYLVHSRPHLFATDSAYLFPASNGEHLSVSSVQQYLRRLVKKATPGDKRIYCHLFRHSFATHTLNDGASIAHVKSIMGHQSIATTLKYVHLKPSDLKREHSMHSPVKYLKIARKYRRKSERRETDLG
jgi:site-specific recombinase XerD